MTRKITTPDATRQRCITTGCDNPRWEHYSYCEGHVQMAQSAAKDTRKARRKAEKLAEANETNEMMLAAEDDD